MRVLAALVLVFACLGAGAQGCSQCRETIGQTPARTQAAYRRGILVLMVAGMAVFGGGLVAIRKFR